MRLWILRPRREVLAREMHPWNPPYEKVLGLVVRADDEAAARKLAQSQAGYEGLGVYQRLGLSEDEVAVDLWLDPRWTSCEELKAAGEDGVILVDRREA